MLCDISFWRGISNNMFVLDLDSTKHANLEIGKYELDPKSESPTCCERDFKEMLQNSDVTSHELVTRCSTIVRGGHKKGNIRVWGPFVCTRWALGGHFMGTVVTRWALCEYFVSTLNPTRSYGTRF